MLTELIRARNPWEKGPITRLRDAVSAKAGAACGSVLETLALHQRSLGWIFCAILLGGAFAASLLTTLPFLSREIANAEPPLSGKRPPDPFHIQKQLETAVLTADFPLARQKLEELRSLWKNDARLHQAEGALLMVDRQDFAAAREQFLQALSLRPGDAELRFNLAEAEFALGRYEQADAHYRVLEPDPPRADLVRFRRYVCSIKLGRTGEAASIRERASVSFQSPGWYYIAALDALQQGDASRARKFTETARLLHGDKTKIFDHGLARFAGSP